MPVVAVPDTTPADADESENGDAADQPANGNGQASREAAVSALRETIDSLARRGFRRLLVDGQAISIEDVDAAGLVGTTHAAGGRGSHPGRAGRARATDRLDRNRLSRGRRRGVRAPAGRRGWRRTDAAPVQRAVRVPQVRHRVRGPAAAALLVQQPVRRLPDVPRLRQRHRARPGPRRPGPGEDAAPGRRRAVDEAALPRRARDAEERGQAPRRAARHAVERD